MLELSNKGKTLRVGFIAEDAERYYELNNVELMERNQRIPDLKMQACVHLQSNLFAQLIEDVDAVGESVSLLAEYNSVTISGESEYNNYHSTLTPNLDVPSPQRAKYSIEYLKKIIEASNISRNAFIEWSKDYPLRITYQNPVAGISLVFILAPRIDAV